MKRLILISVLAMLAGMLTWAIAQEPPPAPPPPPPPPKAELVGVIGITILPPIKVVAVMERAADYEPEGGFKEGMEGTGMAYQMMMMDGYAKLGEWMNAGNHPVGPSLAMFFEDPEKTPAKDLTCKVMFPVGPDAKGTEKVTIEDLPEMQAAVAQYKGPYEGSDEIWRAVDKWITDNGYIYAGAPMEVYLKGEADKVPPGEFLTEIRWPVKKAEVTEPKE